MRFGFKQPLVGEKRCVTTLITAAEETRNRVVGDFCGSLISQILDFSGFAGKFFANLDFRLYSWE